MPSQIHLCRYLVPVIFVTSLLGCASYHGIDSKQQVRDVTTLATKQSLADFTANGEWPAQAWWHEFGDSQLNALVLEALSHNPSLDIAVARVRAAQATVGNVRSSRSPGINASGDFQWEKLSENGWFPPPIGGSFDSNNTVRLNIDYELDFWGKNRDAVRAAVSQQLAAQAEQAGARLMLSSTVVKTYIAFYKAYLSRDVIEQTLTQREKIYALTKQRVDAGIDTRVELKQAQEQMPALRGQLAQLDENIGALRIALAELLGAGPDRGLQIARPELTADTAALLLPASLPAELLGRRPDIVAARWHVEASKHDIAVAKSEFYPNVNLSAFVGVNSLGLGNLADSGSKIYGYGPAISLPIFSGNKLRHNLNRKYADYESAVAVYNKALTAALHDVAEQLNSLRWLSRRQNEQQQALSIANEALDITTRRYRAGLGNYVSVLNSQTLVLAQQQAGVELQARALGIRVDLIRALGGGFIQQSLAKDH